MPSPAERLAAIAARADAATLGPWEHHLWRTLDGDGFVDGPSAQVCRVDTTKADARFIAAARQDVPDLVAFAQAVLALCDEAPIPRSGMPIGDGVRHEVLSAVRRLADEHLGGA